MDDAKPPPPGHPGDNELNKALGHLHEAERDLEKTRTDETGALHEVEEAIEELEHVKHHHEHWIVVNARREVICGRRVSFEELVKLAFPVPPPGIDVQYTVQFTRGPEHNPSGPLIEGQSVRIRDGMEFDVTPTNRS
jgi:hypothetical protein